MTHHPQACFKLTVRMQRDSPNIPWGFRMQGGSDFNGIPLSVAKISPGSLAEEVGLQPGDIITAVGDPPNPAIDWSHAQAEQVIRQCMDYLVLTIQRGGGRTWEIGRSAAADLPSSNNFGQQRHNQAASLISSALPTDSKYMGGPSPQYQSQNSYTTNNNQDTYVQHSLSANKQDYNPVGTSHNRSARPFGGSGVVPVAGGSNTPPIVHNPYNSPMGLYSADNAQKAFDMQSTALLGSRNGLTISATNPWHPSNFSRTKPRPTGPSPTMQAVNQVDKYGDFGGSFGQSAQTNYTGTSYNQQSNGLTNQQYSSAPVRSVQAPQTMSPDHYVQPAAQVPRCSKCQSGIVGVFVRVRGQPMCVGCYTCVRCHIPLKTIGHFIVDDQLYCEQHAKQATRPGYGGYESRTVYS